MDFVVCPVDGARVKADLAARVVGAPPTLRCPTCGRAFTLSDRGLREVPKDPPDDEA